MQVNLKMNLTEDPLGPYIARSLLR